MNPALVLGTGAELPLYMHVVCLLENGMFYLLKTTVEL